MTNQVNAVLPPHSSNLMSYLLPNYCVYILSFTWGCIYLYWFAIIIFLLEITKTILTNFKILIELKRYLSRIPTFFIKALLPEYFNLWTRNIYSISLIN
ncbi:hypothetical protein BpHYR1_031871 [Brachionus plicatilis]|uniref:Uncharacterized protein n=1 Tax=Brachionus plicatilis TaxID=10195 RepID=A0A3M7QUP8_BRAPC|nr:hypothetical protein BpHYR1_031871 [Brachionus plicatilis]